MTVLFGPSFRLALESRLGVARSTVAVLSAYIKTPALRWLAQSLPTNDVAVVLVTRWQPNDLVRGASDLDAYEFARDKGWSFGIACRLHSKLVLIDDSCLFLGSANFTSSGLHLGVIGNDEACIELQPTTMDLRRIGNYVRDCVWLSDSLYEELKIFLSTNLQTTPPQDLIWPTRVQRLLEPIPTSLYVNDFLFCTPHRLIIERENDVDCSHDSELLELSDEALMAAPLEVKNLIRSKIMATRVWRWLRETLQGAPNQYMLFGELTARVHNSLADDPKPYRKEVKGLVSNLFDWVEWLADERLYIKRYAHTRALCCHNQ